MMIMKRQFQPKGSQSGLPTGWKKVKTNVAPPEATESRRRLRMSGSRKAVPASAKATWPKRSETESLSSGTLVDVRVRIRVGVRVRVRVRVKVRVRVGARASSATVKVRVKVRVRVRVRVSDACPNPNPLLAAQLSSGTLVDVSHRRRGAAVEAVAAAAEAAEAALPPAAEESVVHARRELEARAGTR